MVRIGVQIMKKNQFIKTVIFFTLATVVRLIPHPPNFALMGGFSAWSGQQTQRKGTLRESLFLFLLPLLLMFGTDLILGLHDQIPGVYAGYIAIFLMGRIIPSNSQLGISFFRSIGFASLSTLLFFIISNSWVWYTTYQHSWSTLMECYTMAIPFLGNSFLGDLVAFQLFFVVPTALSISKPAVKIASK
jgi:hypothetical protein